ncbi:MAG: hypothetical protein V4534_01600 [Myxococcota bacterium]
MKCLFLVMFASLSLFADDPLLIPSNRTIVLDRIQSLEAEQADLVKKIETQRAQLKLLKDSVTGNFDTDARLIINNINDVSGNFALQEARYFIDGKEIALLTDDKTKKPIFDDFYPEGKHRIKIEKKYLPNYKIFTYMNAQVYTLTGTVEAVLRPGNTTYVDVTSFESKKKDPLDLKYEVKIIPNGQSGRSILPVSDMPHLVPGSRSAETSLTVYLSKELDANFSISTQELHLDGKKLKASKAGTEGRLGWVLFEGSVTPGSHELVANIAFKGTGKPSFTSKFKKKFNVQPGFKTSLVLSNNQKVKVDQESL